MEKNTCGKCSGTGLINTIYRGKTGERLHGACECPASDFVTWDKESGQYVAMQKYTVTWTVDIEVPGDHKAAAQEVANRYFQTRIAAGEQDSACSFVVSGSDDIPVDIDLADSLSDLDSDDL
ncbi:hypothetical protein QCD61_28340 (plasmid) [Pseudomonas viciae]|uniref:Uncharacterized protein n=1 Tax=Pseudomonas viciae TaxID=2505979 RepID=A0ABY8PMF0_9PSED|nr:hypothetical protein [Pseudomonas viciae]WGO96409.1 hypothetical protein QCD61_28340 [Pseudomonas viciae]